MQATKLLSTLEFPIRWVDMDAYRHVAHTRYFDAMTETRAQWLRNTILDTALNSCLYYVAETQCSYYKAFKYPGVMLVKQSVTDVQSSTFILHYHFFTPGDEKCYAHGITRMVCVDPQTERPVRIPELLRAQLQSL